MTDKIMKLSKPPVFEEFASLKKFMKKEGLPLDGNKKNVLENHVLQMHQANERTTYWVISKSQAMNLVFRPALLKSFTQLYYPTASAYDRYEKEFINNDNFNQRVLGSLRFAFDEWADSTGQNVAKSRRGYLKQKEKTLTKVRELAAKVGLPTYSRMALIRDTGEIQSEPEYPCWLWDSVKFSY